MQFTALRNWALGARLAGLAQWCSGLSATAPYGQKLKIIGLASLALNVLVGYIFSYFALDLEKISHKGLTLTRLTPGTLYTKVYFDRTTWVVWVNNQFATVWFLSLSVYFCFFGSRRNRAAGSFAVKFALYTWFTPKICLLGVRKIKFNI